MVSWTPRDTDQVLLAAFYGAMTGMAIGLYWLAAQLRPA